MLYIFEDRKEGPKGGGCKSPDFQGNHKQKPMLVTEGIAHVKVRGGGAQGEGRDS